MSQIFRAVLVVLLFAASTAHAQITLDGSMVPGTAGSLTGPNFTIPAAVGQTRGSNLFHSFGLFNVQTNQSATFTGPNTISNIFGRVTGGQLSIIDGLLRSTIPNANLYLMNPAGIVFGPNSVLNLPGSFHVTTADYLKFADGAKFQGDLSRQSTLTTAPISAFGFSSQNPAGILVQQTALQIAPGTTLSLIGGDIDVVGDPLFTQQGAPTLSSFGGQLQLASVASPGEVPHNVQDLNPSLFQRMGNISLSSATYLEVGNFSGGGPGNIVIRGGQLLVDNSLVSADNVGSANGALSGIDMLLSREAVIANGSFVTTDNFASGQAGDIRISADRLAIDDATIRLNVFNTGNGGDLRIAARDVTLNNAAEIATDTQGSGNSGKIFLDVGSLTLSAESAIASDTLAAGNGGVIQVKAAGTVSFGGASGMVASAQPGSSGNAGSINVESKHLNATGGSQIFVGTFESGAGGTAQVIVAEDIMLDGIGGDTRAGLPRSSGIASGANPGSTGSAGSLVIQARNVTVSGGAQISSSTFGAGNGGNISVIAGNAIIIDGSAQSGAITINSSIVASNQPGSTGDAGAISVAAKNLRMTNGAQVATSTFGPGNSGTIQVAATGSVTLSGRDPSNASTTISSGSGPGSGGAPGDIFIQAENLTVEGGAQISSSTEGSKRGGNVQITARDTILVDGVGTFLVNGTDATGSAISASSETPSNANAGDILLMAKSLIVRGGQVVSGTFGAGNGGTIHIVADTIELGGFGFKVGPGLILQGGINTSNQPGSTGEAGDILVEAGSIKLVAGAALASETVSAAKGGNIAINAGSITLNDLSTIRATSTGSGNAGDILVQGDVVRMKDSSITTSADFADGGNIHLQISKVLELVNSQITTSVQGGAGAGGNILLIDPQFFILNNSQIIVNAFGGPGGKVTIIADNFNFLATPDSFVSASSAFNPPITDLSGSLAPLPESIVQATTLLRQSCAARYSSGKASTLASPGRGGMPFEPGSLFSTSLSQSEIGSVRSRESTAQLTIGRPWMSGSKFSVNAGCS